MKENINLTITLDELHSIPTFSPNCENEENHKKVFEDCVKKIKVQVTIFLHIVMRAY